MLLFFIVTKHFQEKEMGDKQKKAKKTVITIKLPDGASVFVTPKATTFSTLKAFRKIAERLGKPIGKYLSSPEPKGKEETLPMNMGDGEIGNMTSVHEPSVNSLQACYEIKAENLSNLIEAVTEEDTLDMVAETIVAHTRGITVEQLQSLELEQAILLVLGVIQHNASRLGMLGKPFMGMLKKVMPHLKM